MPIESKVYSTNPSNPALVLVHGLGSGASIWKSLIPELERDFTVYPIDLPGHGDAGLADNESYDPQSLAKLIVDFMKREHGVEKMHVAGNSLGGWITLEMAVVAPENVESVTALAPAGLWLEAPVRRFAPSYDARVLAKISQFFMPVAFRFPPIKALGYRKITHLWRELSYESCRDSVIAMARSKGYGNLWQGARGKKFASPIESQVKVAVIFGDADIMLPEDIAQERSLLPAHAEWIRVANCAHVIMWNHPKLTIEFIKATAGIGSEKKTGKGESGTQDA